MVFLANAVIHSSHCTVVTPCDEKRLQWRSEMAVRLVWCGCVRSAGRLFQSCSPMTSVPKWHGINCTNRWWWVWQCNGSSCVVVRQLVSQRKRTLQRRLSTFQRCKAERCDHRTTAWSLRRQLESDRRPCTIAHTLRQVRAYTGSRSVTAVASPAADIGMKRLHLQWLSPAEDSSPIPSLLLCQLLRIRLYNTTHTKCNHHQSIKFIVLRLKTKNNNNAVHVNNGSAVKPRVLKT